MFEPMESEMLRDCAAQLHELAALAEEFGAGADALGGAHAWLAALSALLPPPSPLPPSHHAALVSLFAARLLARRLMRFCEDRLAPALQSSSDVSQMNFETTDKSFDANKSFDAAVEKYVRETCQEALRSLALEANSKIQLSHFSRGRSLAQLFGSPAATAQTEQPLPNGCCAELREVHASGQLSFGLVWGSSRGGAGLEARRRSLAHVRYCAEHKARSRRSDTRLRHSIGSSQLDLVRQVARAAAEEEKVVKVGFKVVEMSSHHRPEGEEHPVARKDRTLVDKLWKFFDELAKRKYCRGPPLMLKVRRNSLLEDAFKTLMAPSRKPLSYYSNIELQFANDEEGEEEADLLPVVGQALFSPHHPLRLFECASEESPHLYPNPASAALPEWFQMCGAVLALAFLHQRPLMVSLPKCFYKCLFDRPMSLPDLEELDPVLLRRLQWLRSHDVGSAGQFSFTVRDRMGALSYSAELLEGGAQTPVTDANKRAYVEACLRWKLAERCLLQLQEVRKGFVAVLDPTLLDRFSEDELKSMIEQEADYSDSEDDERPRKSHSL